MTKAKLNSPLAYRRELPAVRRAEVIDAALRIAARVGAQGLVRDKIAEEAGMSSSLLHRYFGSMDLLRDIVIQTAFQRGLTDVLYKSLSVEDFKRLNTNAALAKQTAKFITT
jgi:AcrR family transcriptional regulator